LKSCFQWVSLKADNKPFHSLLFNNHTCTTYDQISHHWYPLFWFCLFEFCLKMCEEFLIFEICWSNKIPIKSIFLTLHKLFQNPINISIKEETNQIFELTWNEKNKEQRERYRTLLRLFPPTHLHQFNKFLRTIWRNCWCQSFVSVIKWNDQNEKFVKRKVKRKRIETNKQTNKHTEWELQLDLDQCQCEVHVEKQFHKQQQPLFNSY
jgi:hypothetical protein